MRRAKFIPAIETLESRQLLFASLDEMLPNQDSSSTAAKASTEAVEQASEILTEASHFVNEYVGETASDSTSGRSAVNVYRDFVIHNTIPSRQSPKDAGSHESLDVTGVYRAGESLGQVEFQATSDVGHVHNRDLSALVVVVGNWQGDANVSSRNSGCAIPGEDRPDLSGNAVAVEHDARLESDLHNEGVPTSADAGQDEITTPAKKKKQVVSKSKKTDQEQTASRKKVVFKTDLNGEDVGNSRPPRKAVKKAVSSR